MVVYVDDFKLSGPAANLPKGWALLRKTLNIDKETGQGQYLGCGHEAGTFTMPDGTLARSVVWNMENFWESCVLRYTELAGPNVRMKVVPTPFLVEDSEKGPAGAPCATGPISECPWCTHTFTPKTYRNLDELNKEHKKNMPTGIVFGGDDEETPRGGNSATAHKRESSPCGGNSADSTKPQIKGRLAEFAACVLMKCLYGARYARFDLLRAIVSLACQLTRWTPECDRKLHRLVCYIHCSKNLRMLGYMGNSLQEV